MPSRSVSPLTASSVANRVAVSTPLRTASSLAVMGLLLNRYRPRRRRDPGRRPGSPDGTGGTSVPTTDLRHPCSARTAGGTLDGVTTVGPAKGAEVTAREAEIL